MEAQSASIVLTGNRGISDCKPKHDHISRVGKGALSARFPRGYDDGGHFALPTLQVRWHRYDSNLGNAGYPCRATAILTASIKERPTKGLSRKATQPVSSAQARVAASSRAVMKMTGTAQPHEARRRRSSMPDMPPRSMSSNRQSASVAAPGSRNASAEANTLVA